MNPFATSLALYLSIDPSALCFTVKTHLQPTGLFPAGGVTSSHVSFFTKAFISSTMASFHLGSRNASFQFCGIDTEDKEEKNPLTEEDKESYETKSELGYLVRFLTPFRKAIGISRSSGVESEG